MISNLITTRTVSGPASRLSIGSRNSENACIVSAAISDAERNHPEIWNLCYPRHYQVAPIYPPPKQLAAELVCIYSAYVSKKPVRPGELALVYQATCGAAGLVLMRVPIFFVTPDLLQAVQLSIPPVDLDWVNMHLPFESGSFALPRGSLSHPPMSLR